MMIYIFFWSTSNQFSWKTLYKQEKIWTGEAGFVAMWGTTKRIDKLCWKTLYKQEKIWLMRHALLQCEVRQSGSSPEVWSSQFCDIYDKVCCYDKACHNRRNKNSIQVICIFCCMKLKQSCSCNVSEVWNYLRTVADLRSFTFFSRFSVICFTV